ncbi:polyprenyl synthetase family protein [Lysinibacter cavernae]|uniref:Geranylgeranyl diphosphate synthase type II n=1 Tax=Lysinibacter cavernae TaxID=1640652 RepID=A0A7X5R3V5_9MICO|nr:polyprenyl synthetase family protein [Lysinibacter cavernae]NIH55199.1 geranylgeranyl diphosphate synthase type II [Lysinibacter cavernae]
MTLLAEFETYTDFRRSFDEAMAEFFAQQHQRAASFDEGYRRLWLALESVSNGGKRIRPVLVNEAFRALGGTSLKTAVSVGLAFELMHTAFVIHDDIIDGDTVRRGQPNVVGQFLAHATAEGLDEVTARHWAESSALIGGDLLLTLAQRMLLAAQVDPAALRLLVDLFDEAVFVTAAGEQADVTYSWTSPADLTLDRVLSMTEHKTAVYSFGAPLMAGAVAAGAAESTVHALGEYGRLLGIAFQLRDDYLGVFGDSTMTGKSVVSDLREGKATPLVVFARTTEAWPRLKSIHGSADLSHEQIADALVLLDECGARAFLEGLIAEYTERAEALSSDPRLPSELGQRLRAVMRTLAARER